MRQGGPALLAVNAMGQPGEGHCRPIPLRRIKARCPKARVCRVHGKAPFQYGQRGLPPPHINEEFSLLGVIQRIKGAPFSRSPIGRGDVVLKARRPSALAPKRSTRPRLQMPGLCEKGRRRA